MTSKKKKAPAPLVPTICERCGVEKRGEWNQSKTCRNVEACKRRVQRAHDLAVSAMCRDMATR
jgi:hypothetical protein